MRRKLSVIFVSRRHRSHRARRPRARQCTVTMMEGVMRSSSQREDDENYDPILFVAIVDVRAFLEEAHGLTAIMTMK